MRHVNKRLSSYYKKKKIGIIILLIPIFSFFIANIFSYRENFYFLDFSNLQNIFSFIIYKEGLELYIAIITIFGLIFTVFGLNIAYNQWKDSENGKKEEDNKLRISDINVFSH
jgi:hypothetical protein